MPIAIGAFFALDAIIIAFVLTLWVFATLAMMRPIVQFMANAANDIPVIGGWLSSEFTDLANYVQQWISSAVQSAYNAGARPFIEMMNTYAHAKSGELYSQSTVNGALYNAIAYTQAHATQRVNEPTQTYVTDNNTANNTYVTNNYQADIGQALDYTQTSYEQLATWANGAIQSVYSDVVDADGRVAAVSASIASGLTQAHDYTDTMSATAEKNAIDVAGSYTLETFHTNENYTTQVRDYATSINADTRSWADEQITQRTNAVADALDGKIAIAVTVAAATETAFADFMNDCGNNLCGGLGNLAKAFGESKNLLGTALLLGFLEEAVREPERTADATVTVADAITAPAKAIISDIFGGV